MTELENLFASYTHAVNWPHKFYEAPRLSTLAMAECGFYYVFDEKVCLFPCRCVCTCCCCCCWF